MLRKISVLVLLVIFGSCSKSELEYNKKETALDLCSSLERYSMSIHRPNIDYDNIKNEYLESINESLDENMFFEETSDFLLHFRDPHVWLIAPFAKMYSIEHLGYVKNINIKTVESNYLGQNDWVKSNILTGVINDTIGYLYISDFKGENNEFESLFDDIINEFSDKSGLIIDLRNNDGGSLYNTQSLLNKLSNQKLLWHTTQNKIENGFDKKYNWYITPKGEFQFQRKIIVLTGRYTISAGERFVMGAKLLPHIRVIGDTTANTQGSVMGRELLNGWKYSFTFEKCLSPEGISYEGVGIAPDILYDSKMLDFTNEDVLIERAIEEL